MPLDAHAKITDAPLITAVAPGPDDGRAWWTTTSDGVCIRFAIWGRDAPKGTVLLFPGRTEYVEKYGNAAAEFHARGFATLAIDWRGQGMADRLLDDPRIGHVNRFSDYQTDLAAVLHHAKTLDLPRPWFLLGHSMGGCIGLRALTNGLDVKAAAFTGPMWGIRLSPAMRPLAWILSHAIPIVGLGDTLSPGTKINPYVLTEPFQDNMLTTDPAMFDMMRDQLKADDELSLGGPSVMWLREALTETLSLSRLPSPDMPCVTFLGTQERIVDVPRIHDRMRRWPRGHLEIVPGAEHEVLMETPDIRTRVIDEIAKRFSTA